MRRRVFRAAPCWQKALLTRLLWCSEFFDVLFIPTNLEGLEWYREDLIWKRGVNMVGKNAVQVLLIGFMIMIFGFGEEGEQFC